ncbi:MAG: UDP-N-acetylmuramate dehydrogenase [Patescibacteria group bacterium]
MQIQKNISLAQFTTFKIGGRAKYFARVKNLEDLKEALDFAKQNQASFFILGGGSNLLIPDTGFAGLIIKMEIKGLHLGIVFPSGRGAEIVAGAGENWDTVVACTTKQGLFGLENLSGIPGTIGASVVQNIGAFGAEAGDNISWVEVFNAKTFALQKLCKKRCGFGYRNSVFKTRAGKDLIVIRVCYKLKIKGKPNLFYAGLQEKLKNRRCGKITSRAVREAILEIRKEKYPDLKKIGTAGCFFQNPIISATAFKKLKKLFPELPSYNLPDGKIKIPLAWLMEKLGWKGYRDGNVGIHQKHALVIVNFGNGVATDIKKLADKITRDIFSKTNIKIFPEVVSVG